MKAVPGGAGRSGGRSEQEWADEEAEQSQLVRPYTLTRGRTWHAESDAFDVIAQISAVEEEQQPEGGGPVLDAEDAQDALDAQDPEQQAILELVRQHPLSVAEVASRTDLPLGVVRILLGDLLDAGLITVSRPVPAAQLPDVRILREVIQGLRAL